MSECHTKEPSELPAGATTPRLQSGSGWSEAGLAALLLRLMGVYFTAWAIITGTDEAIRLFLASREFGLDYALAKHWTYLSYPAAQLIVGIYFLVGGRWVYEKVLTPVTRNPADDTLNDRGESSADGGLKA
jgi:hypothetical protein